MKQPPSRDMFCNLFVISCNRFKLLFERALDLRYSVFPTMHDNVISRGSWNLKIRGYAHISIMFIAIFLFSEHLAISNLSSIAMAFLFFEASEEVICYSYVHPVEGQGSTRCRGVQSKSQNLCGYVWKWRLSLDLNRLMLQWSGKQRPWYRFQKCCASGLKAAWLELTSPHRIQKEWERFAILCKVSRMLAVKFRADGTKFIWTFSMENSDRAARGLQHVVCEKGAEVEHYPSPTSTRRRIRILSRAKSEDCAFPLHIR